MLASGQIVQDRFVIEGAAGAGSMGTVYRALDRATQQRVAFKVVVGSGLARERFAREAGLLRELAHPGIVRYVADGTLDATNLFLVMEWVEGSALSQRLEHEGLDAAEAVALVADVADAVGAAHRVGVVHRDLKPDNILLDGGDVAQVRLIDFSIARLVEDTTTVTSTGVLVGTPGYLAPEQARCDAKIDARADVFALGCVLYECLTGCPAYAGENFMMRLTKVLFGQPRELRALCPEASPALVALLSRMMALDPAERPTDGAAVASSLRVIPGLVGPRRRRAPSDAPTLPGRSRPFDAAVTMDALVLVSADEENAPLSSDVDALLPIASTEGARFEQLADGSCVVSMRVASDDLERAVRCARAVHAALPARPIALTLERAATEDLDIAIERGVHRLQQHAMQVLFAPAQGTALPGSPIALDAPTAAYLAARMRIIHTAAGDYLPGES